MGRSVLFITVLFAAGCANYDQRNDKVVYDEPALKQFVLSTHDASIHTPAITLDSILQNANQDSTVFLRTVTYLEQPFGSPNSAYRNDSLYATLLSSKAESPWIDTVFKRKANERLYLIKQNLPGTIANDFIYHTPAGYQKKLHDLKSTFILLFFYNPECPACKEMKAALTSSAIISQKIKSNELKVMAMYTDRDEKVWLNHLAEMPQNWIHGRDQDEYLYNHNVYDLRAIPTLYLLDVDKVVLLKDCIDINKIERVMMSGRYPR